ncbi:protein FAR1-RELATED SEQUENCE 3-like isoform X2 [Henckelia pumila]|uniref:protein FAR1-RELATED SEQUENCE 3-like isoform X2 n=1 Tax=Henckelia pumila TaxID=405737 RepID=UPI003C6E476D
MDSQVVEVEYEHQNEKPYVGMEFNSEESAKNCYDAYARRVGFSSHVGQYTRTKPDGPIVSWEFACSREIFKRKNVESCNAMLSIKKKDPDKWVVANFVEDHNHSTITPTKVHHLRPRRHFTATKNTMLQTPNDAVRGNHFFCQPNLLHSVETRNPSAPVASSTETINTVPLMPLHFIRPSSRRTFGKDAQNLLTYFRTIQVQNPGFYYAIQLDVDNRLSNVFWADARSRMAYSHFGDAVVFDTMYRPKQFQVPLAPFTGVNHHGQMVLFGCALLMDESDASFAWVFKTWLSAMNNRPPVSITTDQDRAIKAAVHQVFPETRHCICKWHILREGQERLAHTCIAHPSFYGEFYSCINFCETIEDFETTWSSILDRYNLWKSDWLQAVYNARKQWAPVYFRNTFFAALSANHGVRSFFDGYVNQQSTIPLFFKQYERALEKALESEIEADYDTICTTPVLKTPSPMEQQAVNLYTKKVFAKFQEELVETFVYTANKIDGNGTVSRFRVAKYEHDHKEYIVTLDVSEMNACCSCQMFEYSGVLCRHILTVFTVTNVLTIPSHYILKRWTQNARAVLLNVQEAAVQPIDALTSRFNSICLEALKFAEEGAVASETFKEAMECLRDGARKIAMVKKNVARIKPPISQESGSFLDNDINKASSLTSDTIPSLWPWQDATQNHFNLNDAGVNVADLNQPTMAPVVINRDVALADNMLQDYGKAPSGETEVQFRVTRVTLEPMLKSMTYISQQLLTPANRVAVINLKLQNTKTSTGETEVKFQVSRDTLGSMLRSMASIREQL